MVYTSANRVIAATNTAQRLSASHVQAAWVLVQASGNNGGDIYVGGANPASKQSSLVSQTNFVGILLTAGEAMVFPPSTVATPYDLYEMWVSGTQNDEVSVVYLTR